MAGHPPHRTALGTPAAPGLRPLRPGATSGRGLFSAADVGASNRVAILQTLVEYGPSSRAELARIAHVPRGSVAPIVAGLLDGGFLVEQPATASTGKGKPSRPLWFGSRVGHLAALQIRADAVEAARVDQRGHIIERRSTCLGAAATRAEIETAALGLARDVFGPQHRPLCGIGLVWPAVWNSQGRVLECTPLPALVGSMLIEQLTAATGLPVVVEDDARALAIGQRWFGEARGADAFAALQISQGIGAGIIIGGRLFHVDDVYPEVGHMCVDLNGVRCRCGQLGCWETVASLQWLQRVAVARGLESERPVSPASLVALRHDSPVADELLRDFATNIAIGLANLAVLFALTRLVLHGEVVGGGPQLLALIEAALAERMTLPSIARPTIELSALNQEAGLLGGAAAALMHALEQTPAS